MAATTADKSSQKSKEPEPEALTIETVGALFGLDRALVLAFKDYGQYVVVVTTDGQKLQADKHGQE